MLFVVCVPVVSPTSDPRLIVSELLEGEEVEHQVCTPGAHEQNVPVERCVKEV